MSRFNLLLSAVAALCLGLAACDNRSTAPAPKTSDASPSKGAAPASPGAGAAPTRPTDAGRAGAPAEMDREFVAKAAASGIAEVELTATVAQRGASADVKALAEHLHRDHSAANADLQRIAGEKGMTLPAEPDEAKRAQIAKLSALSGPELDRAVVPHLVRSHEESIALFERESASGSDAELKTFAEKTLPTLREHLAMAKKIQDRGLAKN